MPLAVPEPLPDAPPAPLADPVAPPPLLVPAPAPPPDALPDPPLVVPLCGAPEVVPLPAFEPLAGLPDEPLFGVPLPFDPETEPTPLELPEPDCVPDDPEVPQATATADKHRTTLLFVFMNPFPTLSSRRLPCSGATRSVSYVRLERAPDAGKGA
jgi:hypothetical protein